MISGWTAVSCIVALAVVVPMHLGLWLPLADRRLAQESGPGRMGRLAAWLVFVATIGLHGLWTQLTSTALIPAMGSLLGLIVANVLLAPIFFTVSYDIWLHWRLLRQPDRQPWLAVGSDESEDELPSVTVVIACRNEPVEVTLMTLGSAQQLRYPRNKLAFLIADNSDEDHPDYLALCREVEAQQRSGQPIELLHRHGTRGFKAGNLDMAVKVARTDLLFFLDVDNSVPEDLLLVNAATLWRDPERSYLQLFKFVSNGCRSLVAATAATSIGYSLFRDLALSDYGDWSFFQGHACLWKRCDLLKIVPLGQSFMGSDLLVEDLYMTFRASRLGLHGQTLWFPSAFWAPIRLDDLEKMVGRWSQGTLQCYAKDFLPILRRSMGYGRFSGYASLWYRICKAHITWWLPILSLLLPFSWTAAWLIASLWLLIGLMPSLLVMALKADPNVGGIRCSPMDLLRLHLLHLFQVWSTFRGMILFVSHSKKGWAQTPKVAVGRASKHSWLDVCSRFKGALLFSLLAPGLALAWKGVLFGQPLLSPATFPVLYLAAGCFVAVLVFAPLRRAPARSLLRDQALPDWMARAAERGSQEVG